MCKILDKYKQVDRKPAGQHEHATLNKYPKKSCLAHAQMMLAHRFLRNVNDARALSGACSVVRIFVDGVHYHVC